MDINFCIKSNQMFFGDKDQQLEQTISKHDLLMQELMIRIDGLDREIKALLTELKVSPEKVAAFVENPENFTEQNWQELQVQRKLLDEKLSCEISNIRDPRKTQKNQNDRHVQRHWLFVK